MVSGLMERAFDPSMCEGDRWISVSLRQVLVYIESSRTSRAI